MSSVRIAAVGDVPDALRRDVRWLGDALGAVIRESGGADLLAEVERLRHAVIAIHHGEAADEQPAAIAAGYPPARAEAVARAFTVYFQLVNLAEERQRVRALRAGGADVRPDSFAGVVASLGEQATAAALRDVRVHPVLTAHPTESRRRAVQSAVARIGAQLDRLDDPRLGAAEQSDARRRLLEEVTVLWRTAQVRPRRPEPLDEVRAVLAVFEDTLVTMVPQVYRAAAAALQGDAAGAQPPPVPAFLAYGSWVGGDRDGNPHVTAEVTRAAADLQADHALRALAAAAERIGRTLTVDAAATPPSAALTAALAQAADAHPEVAGALAASSVGEPHRQWLLWCAERFAATRRRDADLGYPSPDAARADLALLAESLLAAGAARVAFGELASLRWQLDTFGFHLAALEVRQHSDVHRRALAAYGLPADADGLAGWLATAPAEPAPRAESGDPVVDDVVATLRTMAAVQRRWGAAACRRYVVSFTHDVADLLAVRALARVAVGSAPLSLDVVPLFETEADLARAVRVLTEWAAVPGGLGDAEELEVMLGYSDSAKDVGPVAATLALYAAQEELVRWADGRGLRLTLFHGRGGAAGRGGGPAGRAVLSGPPGSVRHGFKVTEQGEVISARYGHAPIAVRHLEQVTAAVLVAGTPAHERRTAEAAAEFAPLAATLSRASADAYRALVTTDGFAAFVAQVSPLDELGDLHIGSRPARRRSSDGLESLRAIPWVFAWAQTRVNLPGWYGLGAGLAAAREQHGLPTLQRAYARWPLFASLLDTAEMSLAKTDAAIARRYLDLGERPDLAARVLDERERAVAELLAVTGHDRLLAGRPVLARAVALRNPYVDALSYLQLAALAALRADPAAARSPAQRQVLLLTINGIAAGLQNTG